MKLEQISNEHTAKIDPIKELSVAYYLAKALHYQMRYLREYVNDDFKKRLSEAAAKNNYFCSGIEKLVPQSEEFALEEICMQVLEKVNEVDFNQKIGQVIISPEEKAKELTDKMYSTQGPEYGITEYEAQQCALIAVEEMINGVPYDNSYWQQVKIEIKNL